MDAQAGPSTGEGEEHRDGERFLMTTRVRPSSYTLLLDWPLRVEKNTR